MLSTFVNQAGIAIENARFLAVQDRRYSELVTLYDVSKTLAATSAYRRRRRRSTTWRPRSPTATPGCCCCSTPRGGSERPPLARRRGGPGPTASLVSVPGPRSGRRAHLRAPRLLPPATRGAVRAGLAAGHRGVPGATPGDGAGPPGRRQPRGRIPGAGTSGRGFGQEELKLIAVASSQAAAVLSSAASYNGGSGSGSWSCPPSTS